MVNELPKARKVFCVDLSMVKASCDKEASLPIKILQGDLFPLNDLKPDLACITSKSFKEMYHQNYGLVKWIFKKAMKNILLID